MIEINGFICIAMLAIFIVAVLFFASKTIKHAKQLELKLEKAERDLSVTETNYVNVSSRLSSLQVTHDTMVEANQAKHTRLSELLESAQSDLIEMQNSASKLSDERDFVLVTKNELSTIVRNHNNRVDRVQDVFPTARLIKETTDEFVNGFASIDYQSGKVSGRYYILGVDRMI